MAMRCFIAGAGEYTGLFVPGRGDYIIAADGGYASLVSRGITPDLVVGDFDSLGAAPNHPNVIHSPVEKDDTDVMLAVRQGLAHGFKSFVIDGGLDGRLDHTIANIQVLVHLTRNGARGILLGSDMCVTAVTNGQALFNPGGTTTDTAFTRCISIFSAGDKADGVTLTGLKYPLRDAKITNEYPVGVSNEFTGKPAVVSVREGTLIVIWSGSPGMYVS